MEAREVDIFSFEILAIVAMAMLVGGLVKGVIGFGLPLVAMSLLSSFIPVETALGLMVFPILATNLYQGLAGGRVGETLTRFWPLIAMLGVGIALGASFVKHAEPDHLLLLMAFVVLGYCFLQLVGIDIRISRPRERITGLVFGIISGFIGGVTSAYGPPLTIYFNALKLEKEFFVTVAGIVWSSASLFLLVAFWSVSVLTYDRALISAFAVAPSLIGLWLGAKGRRRLDDILFRRLIVWLLLLVGLNLLRRVFL